MLYEGFLIKSSVSAPAWLKNWRRRWVVIDNGRVRWFDAPFALGAASKPEPRAKGEPLRLDEDSRLESSDARPFALKVVAAACGRELVLQASNSAEYLALWSALQAAMNVVTERSP